MGASGSESDDGSALGKDDLEDDNILGFDPENPFTVVKVEDDLNAATSSKKKWRTPEAWLQQEEFNEHVDFNVWNNYDECDFYSADDSLWIEDICFGKSIEHILAVTDEYLTDHTSINNAIDDKKFWERQLHAKVIEASSGEVDESLYREPIPGHLTPDQELGVTYSNEILEMKGRLTLAAELPPPAELWKDDTFNYANDTALLNSVGTIREQYEWTPVDVEKRHIDDAIKVKIEPLIRYANHAAKLVSTRDGVLVFEYYG